LSPTLKLSICRAFNFSTYGLPVTRPESDQTTLRSAAAPSDACVSYQTLSKALSEFEADLHQHIHLENNILFPRAIAMEQTQ
jgi:hypothetical protein